MKEIRKNIKCYIENPSDNLQGFCFAKKIKNLSSKIEIKNQVMNLNCEYLISIRKKRAAKVEKLFTDLRCLKIKEVKQ